jgi:hypothetical protein
MTTGPTETVRLADARYSRPFPDHQLRPMVSVEYDDGDRFVTYAVGADVLNAWAEVDTFGRQLTEADL